MHRYYNRSDFIPVDDSIREGDPKCKQDGVAPQIQVRGLPMDFAQNAFIPDNAFKPGTIKSIKNFVDAHLMKNQGWILKLDDITTGKIQKRYD